MKNSKPKQPFISPKDFYNQDTSVIHYSQNPGLFPKEETAFKYLPANALILDLGCGTGRTTLWLKQQGHQVIGADIAFNMVCSLKSSHPTQPVVTANASQLPFKTDCFDAVIFSFNGIDLIYPYENRQLALKHIKRTLKPNGIFIFSAHNNCIPRDLEGIRPFLFSLFAKSRNGYMDSYEGVNQVKIYLTTPDKQIDDLNQLGFKVISLVPRKVLSKFTRFKRLIGLLDNWVYYVCKADF